MNILLLSGAHPALPHISGVRAARFADELARRGHRCVLLCPALPGETPLADPFEGHDWSRACIVPVVELAEPASRGPLARLSTAIHVLRFGGKRTSLYRALVDRAAALRSSFPVDAIWTTFGSLEVVFATRKIASNQRIPWLLDVKDNADLYVPKALRRPLAWRLRGFAALQSNAELHAEAASRWLGRPAEVVYSGVDPCFFPAGSQPIRRHVTLIGGLYHPEQVDAFVDGIAAFNRAASEPVTIVHLGTQIAMLKASAARHGTLVPVHGPGYVSSAEMATISQSALANCYVFFGRGFHHKLFELIACRRPVIAFGGELPESISVAAQLHAPLHAPTTPAALAATLAEIDAPNYAIDPALPDRFFTWPDQAAMVDAAMRRLVE